jgi:hypothetical protein
MVLHTGHASEADDQFALAYFLMTPKFETQGIIAGHFDKVAQYEFSLYKYKNGETTKTGFDEILKVLELHGRFLCQTRAKLRRLRTLIKSKDGGRNGISVRK